VGACNRDFSRVAIAGAARTGKDEVAKSLVTELGYTRHSFGDILKRQLRPLLLQYTGIDAFTEIDAEKKIIRPTLEAWSVTNGPGLVREYWETAPAKLINNRLVKVDEAAEFKNHGGVIVWLERPGKGPVSAWEAEQLEKLKASGLIDLTLLNDGTLEDLRRKVLELFGGGGV
jgi:dephospho-CoA kinase